MVDDHKEKHIAVRELIRNLRSFLHFQAVMESSELKPDIFISYNRADAPWVRTLAARIESETVDGSPNGRHLRVFFAEWDIAAGQNIVNRINEGLEQARFVALVMSPEFSNPRGATSNGRTWFHSIPQTKPDACSRCISVQHCSRLRSMRGTGWISAMRSILRSNFIGLSMRFARNHRLVAREHHRRSRPRFSIQFCLLRRGNPMQSLRC